MGERTQVTKQFSVGGIRLRASIYKRPDGWKIGTVGAVNIPTALLPFEVSSVAMDLVRRPAFPTKEAAFGALNHPEA